MSLTLFIDDICPRCRNPINLSLIEPHPTRTDLALHNFECADCGVVKTKIYSLKPNARRPKLAA
jgi:hypothetical protein